MINKNVLRTLKLAILNRIGLIGYRKKIGAGSYIDHTVQVLGWKHVEIGKNSIVSEYSWLNVNKRVKDQKHIVIGDNCYIGRRNFFTSGKLIHIGAYCSTSVDCKFLGSSHEITNPYNPYVLSETTCSNSIILGANVNVNASVSIIGNVKIGHGCVIGAGTIVTKDIPPFSLVVGVPARIIKRFDFVNLQWVDAEHFLNNETGFPDEMKYINLLQSRCPNLYIPLQAATTLYGDLL